MDITEELVNDIQNSLKASPVNSDEIPDLTVQTVAQCWTGDYSPSLEKCYITLKTYDQTFQMPLVDYIKDYIDEELWNDDPYDVDSDTVDWEDENDFTRSEWDMICSDNPDFPDEEDK